MDRGDEIEDIIRAKWTIDEARTLSEAAALLRAKADELEQLEREGWQLIDRVYDDYGYITRGGGHESDT